LRQSLNATLLLLLRHYNQHNISQPLCPKDSTLTQHRQGRRGGCELLWLNLHLFSFNSTPFPAAKVAPVIITFLICFLCSSPLSPKRSASSGGEVVSIRWDRRDPRERGGDDAGLERKWGRIGRLRREDEPKTGMYELSAPRPARWAAACTYFGLLADGFSLCAVGFCCCSGLCWL
jgi:hypothetical protein